MGVSTDAPMPRRADPGGGNVRHTEEDAMSHPPSGPSGQDGRIRRSALREPQMAVALVAGAALLIEAVLAKNVLEVRLDVFSQLIGMWLFIAYQVTGLRDRRSAVAASAAIVLATAAVLVLYAL